MMLSGFPLNSLLGNSALGHLIFCQCCLGFGPRGIIPPSRKDGETIIQNFSICDPVFCIGQGRTVTWTPVHTLRSSRQLLCMLPGSLEYRPGLYEICLEKAPQRQSGSRGQACPFHFRQILQRRNSRCKRGLPLRPSPFAWESSPSDSYHPLSHE